MLNKKRTQSYMNLSITDNTKDNPNEMMIIDKDGEVILSSEGNHVTIGILTNKMFHFLKKPVIIINHPFNGETRITQDLSKKPIVGSYTENWNIYEDSVISLKFLKTIIKSNMHDCLVLKEKHITHEEQVYNDSIKELKKVLK